MTMKKMERFYELGGAKFKFLKRFFLIKVDSEAGVPTSNIEIYLTEKPQVDTGGLYARFHGVTELKIGDLNGLLSSVIIVSDISSRGLEDVRFKVTDIEAGCFSFLCMDFEFDR